MPIYKVTTTLPDETHAMKAVAVVKLVDAANVNAAVRHASKAFITAEVADGAELVELGAKGVKLERANGAD